MKKCLSLVLALVMMLTMLPMSASAASTVPTDRDLILTDACTVFPEFADRIRLDPSPATTSPLTRSRVEVVFNETRTASDNKLMTYTEYSDGTFSIADAVCTSREELVSETNLGGGVQLVFNIKAIRSGYSGYYGRSNFKITKIYDGYSRIDSIGVEDKTENWKLFETTKNLQETASSRAYVYFHIGCYSGTKLFDSDFLIGLENFKFYIEHTAR